MEKKKENKLSPAYESEPYKVEAQYGDQIHIRSPQGVAYKRNIHHLKRFNKPIQDTAVEQPKDVHAAEPVQTDGEAEPSDRSKEVTAASTRKSSREVKSPEWFKDFVMWT